RESSLHFARQLGDGRRRAPAGIEAARARSGLRDDGLGRFSTSLQVPGTRVPLLLERLSGEVSNESRAVYLTEPRVHHVTAPGYSNSRAFRGGAASERGCVAERPRGTGRHDLHLPDASADPPQRAGQLPDLRNGARATAAGGGGSSKPRAARHGPALLDRRRARTALAGP